MGDDGPVRLFTLAEANELVPDLTEIFEAAQTEQAQVQEMLPQIRRAVRRAEEGGGSEFGPRYVAALERISELLQRVVSLGVVVKDPEQGLCDFPHEQQGEVVLLCWKYGEPEVAWWHTQDSGFSSRRAVAELTDMDSDGVADPDPDHNLADDVDDGPGNGLSDGSDDPREKN